MWQPKLTMKCPVCPAILGRRDKGVAAAFECVECKWIYVWDADGVLQAPRRPVKAAKKCNCLGCQGKDEK